MNETVTSSSNALTSGGFRIEISPNGMAVTEATSRKAWVSRYLTYAAVAACYAAFSSDRYSWLWVLLLLGLADVFRRMIVGVHNLRCTTENLEVIDVFLGRSEETRTFPRAEVRQVRFGAVSFSRYGNNGGLIFEAERERVKVLYGLKCIEAQKILEELKRFGFDILVDVGMPMMIEMEQSRRRSWLGRLFN